MILETDMFLAEHRASGRYLKSDFHARPRDGMAYEPYYWLVPNPFAADVLYSRRGWEMTFASEKNGWNLVADHFDIVPRPGCKCCGATNIMLHIDMEADFRDHPSIRCYKHKDRNPCAIEGCPRTTALKGSVRTTDAWLCSEHWKRFCPPRSARRRAYRSFFNKAKKLGLTSKDRWPVELEDGYWRFWDLLIRNARAKHAATGALDPSEINRLFGWTE